MYNVTKGVPGSAEFRRQRKLLPLVESHRYVVIVDHLRERDFFVRIASRDPTRARELFGPDGPQCQSTEADIHDPDAVAHASLAGAYEVVNSVSLSRLLPILPMFGRGLTRFMWATWLRPSPGP
jgi:hypothetical protein